MMTKTSNATAAHSVIREIVDSAENIAAQAGVGSSETAGVIVSFLAERPSLMSAFMTGTLSPIDTGMLDHHNGVLSWHGQDGGIHQPDPSKARFPAPPPEALPARTAYDDIGFGVKVRALEWDEHGSAQALGLRYEVWLHRDVADGYKERWLAAQINGATDRLGGFNSRDEAKAAAQADFERRVLSCLSTHTAAGAGPVERSGIYVASKTRHAPMWKEYRERGWAINSTWIDEAGVGESGDLNDLWQRCVAEASSARVLVVYREPDDVLKGGWVEVGAALACGVPVYAVGLDGFTIAHDKRIRHFDTLDDAMDAAAREAVLVASRAPTISSEPEAKGDAGAGPAGEVERLVEETGSSSVDDLRDMALVGHSLLKLIGIATADGPYKDWSPADNPTEIVTDLINDLEEAQANVVRLTLAAEDNQQAAKEAEEARNEAMRGERAAEAALAETRERLEKVEAAAVANGRAGIEAAARYVEALSNAHTKEFGIYDYSTNVTEFYGPSEDIDCLYQELITGIRSLDAACVDRARAALSTQESSAALAGDVRDVRAKAQAILDQASDTYRKLNGQRSSIEGDDGEKCWIVPFDAMEELRAALAGDGKEAGL